ncbi:MAG: hypothetical protein RI958_1290 [Actinomycetota bacterium]|jgi:4-aminobutyrate aminotransferase-like enzyme
MNVPSGNTPAPTAETLRSRRDAVFGAGAPLFYSSPVHLVRGDGAWLYDAGGRRYLDLYNNIPVVGHANRRVAAAMSTQAAQHNTHSRYLDDTIVTYAERLLELHHDDISSIVFACTGTEANEIAMQMARIATGGRGFICTDATYHGNSALVGSLTRAPRRGRPDVHAIPVPQRYRPIEQGLSDEELCDRHLDEVRSAIDDFAAAGVPLAGIVLCSILANEGVPDVPAGFLRRAADLVRAAGGMVIMDEVQAGFCRTGTWWGYEYMGVVPDIVTMGKPMGNGYPLAACAARRELVEGFRRATRYFNTFAASPVHGAVGSAVLDELHDRDIAAQVNDVGGYLLRELRAMADDVEAIGDVRGAGLFIAIDWVTDRETGTPDRAGAASVAEALRERGILLSNAGPDGNIVKVRPPLILERAQADLFLEEFRMVVHARG